MSGFLDREDLIGKPIIDQNATIIGKVKDIAFGTNLKVGFSVELSGDDEGETFIPLEEIKAMKDVILLKGKDEPIKSEVFEPTESIKEVPPPSTISPTIPEKIEDLICDNCGSTNRPGTKFCTSCGTALNQ